MADSQQAPITARAAGRASLEAEWFERDQRELLNLCGEIRARVEEPLIPYLWPNIWPHVYRIRHLELAERLGFPVPPLVPDKRERDRIVSNLIIWNEPYGGGGELVIRNFLGGVEFSSDEFKRRAAAHLSKLMPLWERAVANVRQPEPYPALPPWTPLDVNPRLFRDPLWRALDNSRKEITRLHADGHYWCRETMPEWVSALDALSIYERMTEGPVFGVLIMRGGRQGNLSAIDPIGSKRREVVLDGDRRLTNASSRMLLGVLSRWQEHREKMLDGVQRQRRAKKGAAVPKVPSRPGPRLKLDSEEIESLRDDWRSSGLTQSEFESRRGMPQGNLKRLYDRLRRRKERGTI